MAQRMYRLRGDAAFVEDGLEELEGEITAVRVRLFAERLVRDDQGYARWGTGGAYSFAACLSHLTVDHASLSGRSTVPTPSGDISSIWALITFFRILQSKLFDDFIPFLFRHLWPLSISCLLYTSPSPRDRTRSRMPSSA